MWRWGAGVMAAAALVGAPTALWAQDWSGAYAGGTIGSAMVRESADQSVRFDTNLDGVFDDTVRTVAGADAFSPGFCNGRALAAVPSSGCTADERGVDVGGRVGYDWQMGALVFGALVDVSTMRLTDGMAAFSVTPAFYTMTREIGHVGGLRARLGAGSSRVLLYGTGGPAWARIDHTFSTSNMANTFVPASDATMTATSWGYQAGGGAEVRLASRWTLTGEYLFTSIDDAEAATVRAQGPVAATNPFILVNPSGTDLQPAQRLDAHGVRVTLGYRF